MKGLWTIKIRPLLKMERCRMGILQDEVSEKTGIAQSAMSLFIMHGLLEVVTVNAVGR